VCRLEKFEHNNLRDGHTGCDERVVLGTAGSPSMLYLQPVCVVAESKSMPTKFFVPIHNSDETSAGENT
jgi:hypothetical protein